MELLVPLRLLVPPGALRALRGDDGWGLERLAADAGAGLDVAEAGAVPAALGGAVLTVQGTMWQKRTAGRHVADRLFEGQGVDPQRWASGCGRLSLVFPVAARGALLGPEAAENVRVVGARLLVDEAPPPGAPPRFLAHLEGNAQQVVSAATRLLTILQDLADHSRLLPGDFAEGGAAAPPSVAAAVSAARLAPAAGAATQPPHQPRGAPQGAPTQALGAPAAAPAPSCLPLLFPRRTLEAHFLPSGHLGEIAQSCGVHIDVEPRGSEAFVVSLRGTVLANAIATIHLQWRAAQLLGS